MYKETNKNKGFLIRNDIYYLHFIKKEEHIFSWKISRGFTTSGMIIV